MIGDFQPFLSNVLQSSVLKQPLNNWNWLFGVPARPWNNFQNLWPEKEQINAAKVQPEVTNGEPWATNDSNLWHDMSPMSHPDGFCWLSIRELHGLLPIIPYTACTYILGQCLSSSPFFPANNHAFGHCSSEIKLAKRFGGRTANILL